MSIKNPNYVMLMMTKYETLESLEGSATHRRYKGAGRELVTKIFNYNEVFVTHFNHRHQVDYNNNWSHYPISVKRNWTTRYCPNRCHSYLLELTDVNENYLWGYLVDRIDVETQLDFWCHFK